MAFLFIGFEFVVLLFSAVLHEVAHGFEAERLGDDTARNAGRLTLNPLAHLDPFGSVLLPLLLFIGTNGAFFFAAAKPVPYNPANLKNPRVGSAQIAIAGPITNVLLAVFFGLLVRILSGFVIQDIFLQLLGIVTLVNLVLAIFNLIPIPPLDGSRILFALLPQTPATYRVMVFLERWGLAIVLAFAFFGFQFVIPVIAWIFRVLTGQPLM